MSTGSIKGITIALGADASDLTKALKESDSALKKTQTQLKEVDRALKFDPSNITLLTQKSTLLENKINDTEASLKGMREALAKMDAQGIDKTSKEYMTLEREVTKSEGKLKELNKELLQTRAAASGIGQLGSKFSEVGGKLTEAGNAMRGISMAAAACSAAIGALAVKSGQWADELNTLSKVYSVSTRDLQMYAGASELVDVDTKTLLGSMQKMKKTMSSAASGTKSSLEAYKSLGVSVKDSNGNLRDSNEVFAETIEALGGIKNATERDAIAMKIFGRSAAQLNPLIEDGGKTYLEFTKALEKHGISYVDQKTLDQANKFNDTIDRTKAVLQQSLMVAGTKLAASLAPVFEKLSDKAMDFAGAISNMNPAVLKFVGAIGGVLAVVSPVLLAFGGISKAIGSSLTQISLLAQKIPMLSGGFKALFGVLAANPIIGVVAALGALSFAAVKSGADMSKLADNIANKVVQVAEKFAELAPKLAENIAKDLPKLIDAGVKIVTGLIKGLAKALPVLIANAPKIVRSLARGIIQSIPALISAGGQLIKGLWQGAGAMVSWVVEKFKGLGKRILNGIKNALGIHSPSREFAKVGMFSMLGLAEGLTKNLGIVDKAMSKVNAAVNPVNLDTSALASPMGASATMSNLPQQMSDAMANELSTLAMLNNQKSAPQTIHNVIEIGGTKVAEQIFRLSEQGRIVLQG